MGMTLNDVVDDYQASLNDAAGVFGDNTTSPTLSSNLSRHLLTAARALSADGKRPRVVTLSLAIVAGTSQYDGVPSDLIAPRATLWGMDGRHAWDAPSGPMPSVHVVGPYDDTIDQDSDGKVFLLSPPPTAPQICAYGSAFVFTYLAAHVLTVDSGTLDFADEWLLILRAQVEAMREMAFRNIHKPVSLRNASGGGTSSNMQPSALYERLLEEYRQAR